MQPLDDYPIGSERDILSSTPVREGASRAWAVGAVALLIAAAVGAFLVMRPSKEAPVTSSDTAASSRAGAPATRGALGPAVEPRELPALDLMDPVVREILSGLSSRPELAAWLATDGLVRSLAASVDAVANGIPPTPHLRSLAPAHPFTAQARGTSFVIDPQSYRRYDGIADTVATLDADGLARAYVTLRPRLQDAYRELGYPDGNIDAAVATALARLLATPLPERDVEVQPAPVLYQFADPRLEKLTGAQKQLLRMGPRNQRIIQDKLRAVSHALGLPSEPSS